MFNYLVTYLLTRTIYLEEVKIKIITVENISAILKIIAKQLSNLKLNIYNITTRSHHKLAAIIKYSLRYLYYVRTETK